MSKQPKDPVDIVAQLREEGFITHMGGLSRESKLLHEAADEIERLRKQRDEARQEVCVAYCDRIGVILCGDTTPQDYAKQRGWDCFDNLSEIS